MLQGPWIFMYGCKTWLLITDGERKTASKKKLLGKY